MTETCPYPEARAVSFVLSHEDTQEHVGSLHCLEKASLGHSGLRIWKGGTQRVQGPASQGNHDN